MLKGVPFFTSYRALDFGFCLSFDRLVPSRCANFKECTFTNLTVAGAVSSGYGSVSRPLFGCVSFSNKIGIGCSVIFFWMPMKFYYYLVLKWRAVMCHGPPVENHKVIGCYRIAHSFGRKIKGYHLLYTPADQHN